MPGEGLEKALELARKIAANSPVTNFAVLQALPRIAQANPAEGFLMESLMAAVAGGSDEAKTRMRAFLEGRAAKVRQSMSAPELLWQAAGGRAGDDPDRPLPDLAGARARRWHSTNYDELHRWSVDDLDGFWSAVWEHFGVRSYTPYERGARPARDAGRGSGSRARR